MVSSDGSSGKQDKDDNDDDASLLVSPPRRPNTRKRSPTAMAGASSAIVTATKKQCIKKTPTKPKPKPTKQVSLSFQTMQRDPVGTKFLLDDSIYEKKSQIPDEVRGMLFEYQVVKVLPFGNVSARFNHLIIDPNENKYHSFKVEHDLPLTLTLREVDDAQELWQQHLGLCNARLHHERQEIEKRQCPIDTETVADVSDIHRLFKEKGRGPHLLEMEHLPVTTLPEMYKMKNNKESRKWRWKHRVTGKVMTRFVSANGKTFDTGKLSKDLGMIEPGPNPLSYQRAQLILELNKRHRNSLVCDGDDDEPHERRVLLAQQVKAVLFAIESNTSAHAFHGMFANRFYASLNVKHRPPHAVMFM